MSNHTLDLIIILVTIAIILCFGIYEHQKKDIPLKAGFYKVDNKLYKCIEFRPEQYKPCLEECKDRYDINIRGEQ